MVSEIRRKKLESIIQKRIATLLTQEMSDPRTGFLTVTRVELDREVLFCTIYYTVLGEKAKRSMVENMLNHARGYIRSQIARTISTRTAPEVIIKFDEKHEQACRLESLINEVAEDVRRREGKEEEPEDDAPEPTETD